MFQPLSLFDQCKKQVRKQYCTNFGVLEKCLPITLFLQLLHDFLHCEEILPLSDEEKDELHLMINSTTIFHRYSFEEYNATITAAIFAFDQDAYEDYDYFTFTNYKNHIRHFYYLETNTLTGSQRSICQKCFLNKCYGATSFSQSVWNACNVAYTEFRMHQIIDEYDLYESLIRCSTNWCRICYIVPLFQILNEDECHENFDCDAMYFNSDNEISDVEDSFVNTKDIVGLVNDDLYNIFFN